MRNNTKRTLSILIEKDPGILLRIISLITRRRFDLETLTIGDCEDKNYKRLTLVISNEYQGSDESASQLLKQLNKLLNIIDIKDISYLPKIERELLLIRIKLNLKEQQQFLNLLKIFDFTVVNFTTTTLSIEIVGDVIKLNKFEAILKDYEVIELVRTGKIAFVEELIPPNEINSKKWI